MFRKVFKIPPKNVVLSNLALLNFAIPPDIRPERALLKFSIEPFIVFPVLVPFTLNKLPVSIGRNNAKGEPDIILTAFSHPPNISSIDVTKLN